LLNEFDLKTFNFKIDRAAKTCFTPRRNTQVEDVVTFTASVSNWAESVIGILYNRSFSVQTDYASDLFQTQSIFDPVVALFDEDETKAKVMVTDANKLLEHSKQTLAAKVNTMKQILSSETSLVTIHEATIVVVGRHMQDVSASHRAGLDYIENMLHAQVIAAIGKHVKAVDLNEYISFHNRKFFAPQFQPKDFCYPVRRAGHVPEGVISIESITVDGASQPIQTTVSMSLAKSEMKFALSSSTQVSFGGERFLHGYMAAQFSDSAAEKLNLVARARQFSSFILMVGNIVANDLFEPKYGIIVQNKDEIVIPLLTETIPSPKEFKDAIASLSPEQQRFCKAFRSMQLGSTLFGVCVIQIKPQLEKVLNLPSDALTKEIQLTQDLMKLFIEHQIPSDLLSYDEQSGWEDAAGSQRSTDVKVSHVQENVKKMLEIIKSESDKQIAEEVLHFNPGSKVCP
jgi:hypothetical protein